MLRQLVESVQLSDLEHGSTAVSYASGHLRGFHVTLNYKYQLERIIGYLSSTLTVSRMITSILIA